MSDDLKSRLEQLRLCRFPSKRKQKIRAKQKKDKLKQHEKEGWV